MERLDGVRRDAGKIGAPLVVPILIALWEYANWEICSIRLLISFMLVCSAGYIGWIVKSYSRKGTEMKRIIVGATIGLVIGGFLGSFTGVAAMGNAWNGMVVFGLLGAFIGGLTAFKRTKPISK